MQNQNDDLFARLAAQAKSGNDFNRLGLGRHTVVIKRYYVKPSDKNKNKQIIVAEFIVMKSDTHKQGESREWAFFPGSDDHGLAEGRAIDFINTVGACIGDNRGPVEIGRSMYGANQTGRGVMLNVEVTERTSKKGQTYQNAKWQPIAQTLEQVAASRRQVDAIDPPNAPQVPSAGQGFQQAPQGFASQQGYANAPTMQPPQFAQNAPQGYAPGFGPPAAGQVMPPQMQPPAPPTQQWPPQPQQGYAPPAQPAPTQPSPAPTWPPPQGGNGGWGTSGGGTPF